VLASLAGFFLTVAAVNAVMITFAVKTFGGVETENAYKAGLAFNRSIAKAEAQDARHWRVDIVRVPQREADFTVTVRDGAGRPISGLTLAATLVHPTTGTCMPFPSAQEGSVSKPRPSRVNGIS
jgi:nitrogen fixation protein FixH